MTRRRTTHAALLALVLLCASPAVGLGAPGGLVVHSVNTSAFPQVVLSLSVPPSLQARDLASARAEVRENGLPAEDVRLRAVRQTAQPQSVVLVFDVSGSMAGGPLADAKAAARRFIASMGPRDEIAVVTFASQPSVLSPFTTDHGALERAVGQLTAKGETALYDGLSSAAGVAAKAANRKRSIVLLSDGGDTVSGRSLETALAEVTRSSAPVFAVALSSPEFDGTTLRTIASRTSGRSLSLSDSASLANLYEGIARQLQNRCELTFTSRQPATKQIELDVALDAGTSRTTAALVMDNPAFQPVATASTGLEPAAPQPVWPIAAAVGLAFAAVALFSFSLAGALFGERNGLDQLRFYEQLKASRNQDPAEEPDGIKAKMMDAVGYVAGRRGLTDVMRRKLEQAGLPLRPVEYMTLHILVVLATGVVARLLSRHLAVSLVAVLVATFLPLLLLENAVGRRRRAFETQLPDVLNLVSGSLRAGYGLLQSLNLVVQEMGAPASSEFARVQTESRLGLAVEDALEKMAERLDSKDFRWTVGAINIQREVGGNLAEVLDTVAATIRDRDALRRQVSALSAEGRLSAMILLVLPFVEGGLLLALNPGYLGQLFSNALGMALVVGAVVLLAVGALWLKRIVSIEV